MSQKHKQKLDPKLEQIINQRVQQRLQQINQLPPNFHPNNNIQPGFGYAHQFPPSNIPIITDRSQKENSEERRRRKKREYKRRKRERKQEKEFKNMLRKLKKEQELLIKERRRFKKEVQMQLMNQKKFQQQFYHQPMDPFQQMMMSPYSPIAAHNSYGPRYPPPQPKKHQRQHSEPLPRLSTQNNQKIVSKKRESELRTLPPVNEPPKNARLARNMEKFRFAVRWVDFGFHFDKYIRSKIEERYKESLQYFSQNIEKIRVEARDLVFESIKPILDSIRLNSSEYNIAPEDLNDPSNQNDLFVSFSLKKQLLTELITSLREFSQTGPGKSFPKPEILQFLARTTHPDAYYPNGYLYQFELKRLTFTTIGTLKKKEEDTESKFLVAMFFVFRSLIRDILLNPEQVFAQSKLNNPTRR